DPERYAQVAAEHQGQRDDAEDHREQAEDVPVALAGGRRGYRVAGRRVRGRRLGVLAVLGLLLPVLLLPVLRLRRVEVVLLGGRRVLLAGRRSGVRGGRGGRLFGPGREQRVRELRYLPVPRRVRLVRVVLVRVLAGSGGARLHEGSS